MGGLQRVQGRGGRPDDGRGWEGRKQRREARADGSGASAPGSGASAGAGVGGEWLGRWRAAWSGASAGGVGGERRGQVGHGGATWEREWGFGGKWRDEAGRVRILG